MICILDVLIFQFSCEFKEQTINIIVILSLDIILFLFNVLLNHIFFFQLHQDQYILYCLYQIRFFHNLLNFFKFILIFAVIHQKI